VYLWFVNKNVRDPPWGFSLTPHMTNPQVDNQSALDQLSP
jgi:hypothetical protein